MRSRLGIGPVGGSRYPTIPVVRTHLRDGAAAPTRADGGELPMESLVTATERAHRGHDVENEYGTILELARRPVSLIEIGAELAVAVAVVRVLVSDLVDGGYLDLHVPPPEFADAGPSPAVLTRLLDGLGSRGRVR